MVPHPKYELPDHKLIEISEAVPWRCSLKKVFLKILQNSQKNTYDILNNTFFIEHLLWLLLKYLPFTSNPPLRM